MLQVGDILPIDEVLTQAAQHTRFFEVRGQQLPINDTLKLVLLHGTTCVCCGRKAVYFQYVNMNKKGGTDLKLHLFFDHKEGNGCLTRMTKDHIVPKAIGGPDKMENYQPMCYNCNSAKGSKVNLDSIPDHLRRYIDVSKLPTQTVGKASSVTTIKRTISTKSLANQPKIGMDYEIMVYIGYIRWYTQVFHKNTTTNNWNNSVRGIIRDECEKVHPNFNKVSFNKAYDKLSTQIKLCHQGKRKEQCIRPATFFRNSL